MGFYPAGQSKTTIVVPEYLDALPGFKSTKEAIYEKKVTIPKTQEWINKVIKLEFDGINFIADVYINDTLIVNHIGGWIPFEVSIPEYIKPGETFVLKVDVKGGSFQPIVDENGLSVFWDRKNDGELFLMFG